MELQFNWSKIGEFALIGGPMAILRTLISKRNRTFDAMFANVLSACIVAPVAGFAMTSWLDNPATPQVEGMGWTFVVSGCAALLGVDLLRGALNLGQAFASKPTQVLGTLYNIWTGKWKNVSDE